MCKILVTDCCHEVNFPSGLLGWVDAVRRKHARCGLKSVNLLAFGCGPVSECVRISLEPENLAMRLRNRPVDRDSLADVFGSVYKSYVWP